jgi:hypothetical protein
MSGSVLQQRNHAFKKSPYKVYVVVVLYYKL